MFNCCQRLMTTITKSRATTTLWSTKNIRQKKQELNWKIMKSNLSWSIEVTDILNSPHDSCSLHPRPHWILLLCKQAWAIWSDRDWQAQKRCAAVIAAVAASRWIVKHRSPSPTAPISDSRRATAWSVRSRDNRVTSLAVRSRSAVEQFKSISTLVTLVSNQCGKAQHSTSLLSLCFVNNEAPKFDTKQLPPFHQTYSLAQHTLWQRRVLNGLHVHVPSIKIHR